jgi:amino acid adenylation domain-containing protein
LFEEQVERTPEVVALECEGMWLTYEELNRRANRLGHYLRGLGVGPEVLVGLCVERSLEMVVGILGILKAGGAYVPLDPEYPAERLTYMLDDTKAAALVTQQRLGPKVGGYVEQTIYLDAGWEVMAGSSEDNPEGVTRSENLAYLIYTSGTSGMPKAVMVEHGNLTNVILASQREFEFSSEDVMPAIASYTFDISLFEIMNMLVTGGRVAIIKKDEILEMERLGELIRGVNVVHMVPSLMQEIISHMGAKAGRGGKCEGVRKVFVGGDRVKPQLLKDISRVFNNAKIYILYGPTEGTIICTSHKVDGHEERQVIGKPLSNMRMRILDRNLEVAPVGVA